MRFLLLIVCLALSFTGCNRVAGQYAVSGAAINLTPIAANDAADMPVDIGYIPTNSHIAVLFGYGYNEEPFVSETLADLRAQFGLASANGLILPYVYPDDFRRGNYYRIADLYDALGEHKIRGLILVGSPEQTHRVLMKLQDDRHGSSFGYPIFSLFSQDDMMGTEAGSDIVIDFASSAVSADIEFTAEVTVQFSENVPAILASIIRYMYCLPSPLAPDNALPVHLAQTLGSGWNILPYIDPETGMHPINHFVIEKK